MNFRRQCLVAPVKSNYRAQRATEAWEVQPTGVCIMFSVRFARDYV